MKFSNPHYMGYVGLIEPKHESLDGNCFISCINLLCFRLRHICFENIISHVPTEHELPPSVLHI